MKQLKSVKGDISSAIVKDNEIINEYKHPQSTSNYTRTRQIIDLERKIDGVTNKVKLMILNYNNHRRYLCDWIVVLK